MRQSLYFFTVALTLGTSATVLAQGGGYGGGTGGGSSFGGGTGGGTSFGGGGTGTSGGTSSFTGGTGGNSFTGSTTFSGGSGGNSFTGTTTGTMSGGAGGGFGGGMRGTGGSGSGFSPSATNFENKTANNVLWVGRPGSTNLSLKSPGGWGQPTLPVSYAGGRGAAGGTASVNRGGAGAGLNSTSSMGGSVVPITYALEVKFRPTPIAPSKFQADLQGIVSRSSMITTPDTVRVVIVDDAVVLRGVVADEDEKRLVEGMVRLEPGVHEVRNELAVIPPKK